MGCGEMGSLVHHPIQGAAAFHQLGSPRRLEGGKDAPEGLDPPAAPFKSEGSWTQCGTRLRPHPPAGGFRGCGSNLPCLPGTQ